MPTSPQPPDPPPLAPGALAILREMPVFGAIPERALTYLNDRAERVAVPAGAWFFREGDRGETMYILRSGQVEVRRALGDGVEVMGTLGAGDCFGEMALIDLYPRSAGVLATADCDAIGISNALLYALYSIDPESFTLIMMNLARELSRRLRETEAHLFRHRDPGYRPHPRGAPGGSEIPYV